MFGDHSISAAGEVEGIPRYNIKRKNGLGMRLREIQDAPSQLGDLLRNHGMTALVADEYGELRGEVEDVDGHDHACVCGPVAVDGAEALLGGEMEDVNLIY